ncbi:MAG: choice-of-anchor J domain-containing protein, partial [Bacteroidota bacterium]|nr:choice-of-anchor J domain-containing protein [Bacteroidota bacterium]
YRVNLIQGQAYDFTVWARQDATSGATLTLAWGTEDNSAAMTNIIVDAQVITNGDYQEVKGTFGVPTDGVYYIGIKGSLTYTPYYMSIDDISLDFGPNCVEPTAIVASEITANSANISWTASVSAPASYHVYYSTTNTAPADDIADAEYAEVTGLTTELSELTPVTTYDVWVRSACGADENSVWTGISFETTPSCFEPTNIQASDITINSANISWTAATESPDATYHVYYSLVDAAPADDIDIAECEAPATNSIELTDLTSSSTYYVWVRSVCGADDFSTWAGPSVFSTSCAIISEYPYFEGFNSGIDPACWTIIDNDNSGDSWYSGTYASTPSYEGASMMVSEFSDPNDDWLISPQFKITSDNLKVDFYAKSYSASFYESFNVLISKTGTSPSDFTIVLENIVDHPNTWQNHEYILSEHGINIDDEIYVAIQHVSNDQFVLFIDAFTVSEIEIPSAEAEILTYSIPNQVGDTEITSTETEGTITVTMPFGTEVTNLVADFTLSDGATAQVDTEDQASGVTPNNFTDPVVYVVTAEDGTTTKNWTVTVNLEAAPSSEAEILTYSLPNQVGEAEINSGATEGTITVTMPYDTEVANLVANFTLSYGATAKVGAIDQETGVTPNNFTDPVVYAVTAQDGSTIKNWTVTVNLEDAPSSEANILTYSFAEQYSPAVIDDVNHTVTVVVNEGTSLDALVATFTLSPGASAKIGAVDQESGVTENNFTDPVIYTVTAEDGTTTQPWTVTVSVYVGIEDVENSAIAIYPNPNNGNFTLDFTNINGKVNYQIYDTKGSIIISDDFVANGSAIKEVSLNLVPGVYFVRLVTETQSLVEKLVVE